MDGTPGDRDVVTLHCSSCGAPFPANATRCSHCAAEVTLEERGLDRLCDVCGARMSARAKFCMRCGKPAALQPTAPVAALRACPRCKGKLRERDIAGGGPLAKTVECGNCGGLWLVPATLDRLCASAEAAQAASTHLLGRAPPLQKIDLGRVSYLPCAQCGSLMVRRNFGGGSGVIVDVCKDHGVWLDHAELEKVLDFVRGGGLEKERERALQRLQQETRDARARRTEPLYAGGDADLLGGYDGTSAYGLPALLGDLFSLFRKKGW